MAAEKNSISPKCSNRNVSTKRGCVAAPGVFLEKELLARSDIVKEEHQYDLDRQGKLQTRNCGTTQVVYRLPDGIRQNVHHQQMPAGGTPRLDKAFIFIPGMVKDTRLVPRITAHTTLYVAEG